ncbi:hypothetical protein [Tessaracoccus massiliensis]|uniref:hypothetical protein n=1 Tax=Tessaracoccus massiliensis TaxID=1522311 RepID=UPI00058FBB2B|nr:hypothetical protein [Tessaracoccus massiliensis]
MRLVLTSVAVVALLVGCSPGDEESPSPSPEPVETTVSESPVVSPSPSPTTESPSPTPTPTPSVFQSYPADLPTEDPESAAIIAAWQEYQRVMDKYLADPDGYTDFTETQNVTTGEEQNIVLDTVQLYRERRIQSRGGLSFDSLTIGEMQPTGEGGQPQVALSYCVDRSQGRVVTYDGEVFPTDHLQPRFKEVSTMEQGLDGVWRVAVVRNGDEPC